MGQVEIVLALHDMIGELVAERETQPPRRPVRRDHVKPDDLGFLAAVEGVIGQRDLGPGRGENAPVALVEPFGLGAGRAALGLAALDAELEHFHRIGKRRFAFELAVHLVAAFGRAEVGEPGAAHQHVRRIGVIERDQQSSLRLDGVEIYCFASRAGGAQLGQAARGRDGLEHEIVNRIRCIEEPRRRAFDQTDAACAALVRELDQPRAHRPTSHP